MFRKPGVTTFRALVSFLTIKVVVTLVTLTVLNTFSGLTFTAKVAVNIITSNSNLETIAALAINVS
jgi:hypothetical protein